MFVANQAVMTCYSHGMLTGIVCDSGEDVTYTVPVYEGFSIPYALNRIELAGRDST
jgi:actin-related protein